MASDHEEAVGSVATELLHQAELPVQVALHRFARIVGTFVGAAVAVDARRRQQAFAVFRRQARGDPGAGAAVENTGLPLSAWTSATAKRASRLLPQVST